MDRPERPLTFNGVHLNESGYFWLALILDAELYGDRPDQTIAGAELELLQAAVQEKNLQHWYDYRAVNGRSGSFQTLLRVYGREGEPCTHCGRIIRRIVQAGRSTYFCPGCQL